MDKYLKPDRFNAEPNSSSCAKEWKHWKKTFDNFLTAIEATDHAIKLNLLNNYVSPDVYEIIADCADYTDAMSLLENTFIKPKNEIFARYKLRTCNLDRLSITLYTNLNS